MKKIVIFLMIFSFCFLNIAKASPIILTWTAPADDAGKPTEKNVTAYKLVYSVSLITEANFNTATVLATTTPKARGQTESYTFDFPTTSHYFFALKSVDAAGNWSAISNVPEKDFLAPSPTVDLSVQ